MSQNILSRRERGIGIRYLPPEIEQNSKKKTLFMPVKIFSDPKLTPLPLHFPGFHAKQNNSYVQVFETSHFKNNCSNPPGKLILLKFCQNVSNS